ncbi:MAG TPA: tail fiber domain-containing protein [bacterium]|nr:tail fiber domain-containing protein [bacterium]
MGFYELDYAGRWVDLSRKPLLGGSNVRYDVGKQEERKTETTAAQSFLPIQETALTQALQSFIDQGRIGAGQPQFPGERLAPFTPGQQAAISGAEPFLDTFAAGREIPFFGETGGALRGILAGETGADIISPQRAQEVFQATRVDPRLRQFERFDKPLIEEQFAGPGFQSTARAQAVTRGGEELSRDIAAEREQFLFGTEQANRALQEARAGRTLSAIPLGAGLAQLPEQVAGARLSGRAGVFDFLTAQQQQQQRGIQVEQQIFQEAQRFMDPEDFANLVALLGLNFQTSFGRAQAFDPSPLQAGLTAAFTEAGTTVGGGVGAGALTAFSDVRVKENIKPITNAIEKIRMLNGNTYNYIDTRPSNRNGGIMAQDLQRVLPDAVSEIDGIKVVRYDAVIGLLIEAVKELSLETQRN